MPTLLAYPKVRSHLTVAKKRLISMFGRRSNIKYSLTVDTVLTRP